MKIDFTFINILIFSNFLIPKILLLILFIAILKFQLKSISYDWRITYAKTHPKKFFYFYKIKNFYVIWFWIFIYLFIFIFLFFSFRIYRIGYKIDLNFVKQTYSSLYSIGEYLLILLGTMSLIIFLLTILLLLKKIKTFLEIYLLQKHLYLINYQKEKKYQRFVDLIQTAQFFNLYPDLSEEGIKYKNKHRDKFLKNGFYKKIFYYFYFFSYSSFIKIIFDLEQKIYNKIFVGTRFENSEIINFGKHFTKILNPRYNILVLLCILLYELIFCNLTIVYVFYVLPFYFLYTLWYRLSFFWYIDRNPSMDVILYELYYDFPIIMYLNLDQEELNVIFRYILGGLNKLPNPIIDEDSISYAIIHYKRYILYDDKVYINQNIKDSISKEQYQKQKEGKKHNNNEEF